MSDRRWIDSGSPFEARYGYARAVRDGDYVFVAGTTGYDWRSMSLPASAADQTRQAWATIGETLLQAGSDLRRVVRATYYVTQRADIEEVLAVCGEVMALTRPAATLVLVAGLLEPGMKVEIEVTARAVTAI
jgi:enamine deaminase RidA (YjgF/YER057c/UK114 family)